MIVVGIYFYGVLFRAKFNKAYTSQDLLLNKLLFLQSLNNVRIEFISFLFLIHKLEASQINLQEISLKSRQKHFLLVCSHYNCFESTGNSLFWCPIDCNERA